jgi:hypothetical protein
MHGNDPSQHICEPSFFSTWQFLFTLFEPIYSGPAGLQVTFELLFQKVFWTFSKRFEPKMGQEGRKDSSSP